MPGNPCPCCPTMTVLMYIKLGCIHAPGGTPNRGRRAVPTTPTVLLKAQNAPHGCYHFYATPFPATPFQKQHMPRTQHSKPKQWLLDRIPTASLTQSQACPVLDDGVACCPQALSQEGLGA
jgi:hypothetical protein